MITFSIKNLRISLTFGFFLVLSLSGLGGMGGQSLLFCAAHELGHLFAMYLFGVSVSAVRFYGAGIAIFADGVSELSKPKRAAVYLSGPIVNLLLAAVIGESARAVNLSLFMLNILPISYFDGGKLLGLALGEKSSAAKIISAICCAAVGAAAAYALVRAGDALEPRALLTVGFIAMAYFLDN